MAETTTQTEKTPGQRKVLIGEVVSTKMAKTIVVEVNRQKAHPLLPARGEAQQEVLCPRRAADRAPGDLVRIEETRPLSSLKRWTLKDVVRAPRRPPPVEAAETRAPKGRAGRAPHRRGGGRRRLSWQCL